MLPEMEDLTNFTAATPSHQSMTFGSKFDIIREVKNFVAIADLQEFEDYWDECMVKDREDMLTKEVITRKIAENTVSKREKAVRLNLIR